MSRGIINRSFFIRLFTCIFMLFNPVGHEFSPTITTTDPIILFIFYKNIHHRALRQGDHLHFSYISLFHNATNYYQSIRSILILFQPTKYQVISSIQLFTKFIHRFIIFSQISQAFLQCKIFNALAAFQRRNFSHNFRNSRNHYLILDSCFINNLDYV